MNDTRTEAQLAANQKLNDAIQDCIDAYFGEGYLVGDFVVATATQYINKDGAIITEHPLLFRDGDIPWYRVLGLINVAEGIAKMSLIDGADNG